MINKNKNQTEYSQFTHSPRSVFFRGIFNYFKKTSTIITIIALVVVTSNLYFFTKDVEAAGIDNVTVTLVTSEAINTASQVQVVFTFTTLIATNTIKIYLGPDTTGDEWQLNAVTTADISCTDNGTGEVYTVNSVTAASATIPMWTQITATTVGTGATAVTCLIGDGTPNPINPISANGYNIAVITTNDSGSGIAYVGNGNDVTVSVDVLPNLSLTVGTADGVYCTTTAGVTSCNLGLALTTTTTSGSYDVDVGTNAASGASVYLAEDGNLRNGANDINDVADSAVTAGSEEYGVALTETGTAWTIDATYAAIDAPVITGPDLAATSAGPVNTSIDNVDIIHKVGIASSTLALTYTHIVTWTATANF